MSGHIYQIRINREVRQAAPEGEEWLLQIAGVLILPDRILDVLPGEQILQLGGEDRQAVQEQNEIQALVVLFAIFDLADDGKEIGFVQLLGFFIEPARRTEIDQAERAAVRLDALP